MGSQVTVDDIEPKDSPSNISINLDSNGNVVKNPTPKNEPKYVSLDDLEGVRKAIDNTREWNSRKISNLESKLDLLLKANQPPPVTSPPKEQTEWDVKLQKDWMGTVDERAQIVAERILREREEKARLESEKQRNFQLLEDNKKYVLDKHIELNNETSKKAEIYRQILQKRPEYLSSPFGPLLAMRDMEDELKETGHVDESTQRLVQKEILRQARVGGGTVPSGASPRQGSKVVLTREQKEFCDLKGIKYENYGKFLNQLKDKGGVQA